MLVTGYTLFIFLAYGTTGSVARLVGAGSPQRAAHEGVQSLWLAVALGIVLAIAGALSAETLVDLMGAEGEVRRHALTYFRISLFGLPALLIALTGTGYLRGFQDTRTPLLVMVGTTMLNLVLEIALIFGLGMGIGASAFATVVAQSLGAVVYVWFVAKGAGGNDVSLRPDLRSIGALLYVGLDLFLRTISLRGVLLASTAVAARIGTTELAANQITLEIWNFLAFALDSLAIAGQAMIGRFLGAGQADEARAAGRRMIELGVVFGVALGVIILTSRSFIAPVFSSDTDVVRVTAHILLFAAIFQPVAAIAFVLDGVLIGAGDQRYLARAMFASALVFVAGAAIVVAFDLGVDALWLAIGAFMTTRAVTLLVRFSSPAWQVLGKR